MGQNYTKYEGEDYLNFEHSWLDPALGNRLDQRCSTGGPRCMLQSPPFLPTFRQILQIFPYHVSRYLPQELFAP